MLSGLRVRLSNHLSLICVQVETQALRRDKYMRIRYQIYICGIRNVLTTKDRPEYFFMHFGIQLLKVLWVSSVMALVLQVVTGMLGSQLRTQSQSGCRTISL